MFASADVKDYDIELDGKPYTIKGERWLGYVNPQNEEKYFTGMIFDPCENGYELCEAGMITRTRQEFESQTCRVCYFK